MSDHPTLEGPTLPPASGGAPDGIVVLLHGVGADGNDLIGLAPHFRSVLPGALMVSPNAPFAYDMAPFGRQWFSIRDLDARSRLAGVRAAAPILDAFIDGLLTDHGLADERLALVGFSQGTMMALHVALRRPRPLAAILGYSGMLVADDLLADEIASRPSVMLIHGDADMVIPVAALPTAVAGLEAAGVAVESHVRPGLDHGIDEEGVRLGLGFLARTFTPGTR